MAFLRPGLRALSSAVLAATLSAGAAAAPPAVATDSAVKAAFLCGFAEFVEWPSAGKDDPVAIGILGQDPFGPLLEETVSNRALRTRALVIKRVATLEEALRCQIVFVSSSEKRKVEEILHELAKSSVLTVSDIDGFADHGGMIGFTIEEKRVRFQINLEAADRARIQISSRLLKLARVVSPESKKGTPG